VTHASHTLGQFKCLLQKLPLFDLPTPFLEWTFRFFLADFFPSLDVTMIMPLFFVVKECTTSPLCALLFLVLSHKTLFVSVANWSLFDPIPLFNPTLRGFSFFLLMRTQSFFSPNQNHLPSLFPVLQFQLPQERLFPPFFQPTSEDTYPPVGTGDALVWYIF